MKLYLDLSFVKWANKMKLTSCQQIVKYQFVQFGVFTRVPNCLVALFYMLIFPYRF